MKPVVLQDIWDGAPTATLYYGIDVIEGLKLLPDSSVHMIATSPPFWGLRDYNVEGQLGLEETPEEYVAKLVEVFREAKRVLRLDGTVWLNLGDSYVGTSGAGTRTENTGRKAAPVGEGGLTGVRPVGMKPSKSNPLKPKDLVGIPWRVALALQADGWYLRSDIIWAKSSYMPESVTDRPTRAHEYVFLFAHPESGGRYYYDADAIREPLAVNAQRTTAHYDTTGRGPRDEGSHAGRNKRSWWNINPKPYKGAHFAVWPAALVEPMILAGTSEKGCCASCGQPWERETKRHGPPGTLEARQEAVEANRKRGIKGGWAGRSGPSSIRPVEAQYSDSIRVSAGAWREMTGWKPGCGCGTEVVKPVVLDPFSGSATTGMVALRQGRDYTGIDLNADYLPLAQARVLGKEAPVDVDDSPLLIMELFDG